MPRILSLLGIELNEVSYKEKFASMLGGVLSIAALVWLTRQALGPVAGPYLIASMGASAVLLFAVPHGQLSQPWPLLGGHGISAILGITCALYLGDGWLAAGCAVGLSIGTMHQLKCIHPPGGATALTAVMMEPETIAELGYAFVLWPVLANAGLMLIVAVLFNYPFPWRRYPVALAADALPAKPHPHGKDTQHQDIVKALQSLDSFVDVTESDLKALAYRIAREREARLIKESRRAPHS